MTKEEIREKLSALCMYASYGLMVKHELQDFPCELHDIDLYRGSVECVPVGEKAYLGTQHFHVEFVKPILRTMESMTEEEKEAYNALQSDVWKPCGTMYYDNYHSIKWLCQRKFDFMNLIPRGLAVDVKTIKGGQYE